MWAGQWSDATGRIRRSSVRVFQPAARSRQDSVLGRDGFAVWAKRLEEGTYAMPFGDDSAEPRREITAQELGALLSGIDLSSAHRRKRYRRKCAVVA
jgi:hypothetical protein